MPDQKIVHLVLITKDSNQVLLDSLQEQSVYAVTDLCNEKGWGLGSANIEPQSAHFELFLPKDQSGVAAMSAVSKAIAEKLFLADPSLEEKTQGNLWSYNPLVIKNRDGDTGYPKNLKTKIQQAILFAYPNKLPGTRYQQ